MLKMKTTRATPLKKQILDLLSEYHLLTAAQILEKLHAQGLGINKTSVYRNLDAFAAENIVCKQSFGDDAFVYELQGNHHDHVCCNSCGKIEEIECQEVKPSKIEGYTIDHHHLTLFGTCQSCSEK